MATLRDRILALRCTSETGSTEDNRLEYKFIPHRSFFELFTRSTVDQAVSEIDESHLEWHLKERTAGWIAERGKLVFGILVVLKHQELISLFTKHNLSDEKLPFRVDVLQESIPGIANEFCEQQWEFTAPTLARDVLHRVFDPKCRMPFIRNDHLENGGFGEIYQITMHPDHQTIPLVSEAMGSGLVRKEFKVFWRDSKVREDEEDHKNEMRCLSILNELKHPNIIQLVASYTYDDKYNLIFPLVQDGNLETLISGDRPERFRLDETFLTALCELSSAIQDVHWYTLGRLNIEMVGFHHDLKPQNILVRGSTFVLADFGLSRLQKVSEPSKSMFEGGSKFYLAPECEDCDDGFKKHSVSRSSDIWSFGCIIAEILTFMQTGAEGVQSFRTSRKVKIGPERMAAFHAGIRNPNKVALDWISGLKREPGHFSEALAELIFSMLAMQPDDRPDARSVASKLRFITIRAHCALVHDLYEELVTKLPNSFDAFSALTKFENWSSIFDKAPSGDDSFSQAMDAQANQLSAIKCLEDIQEELKSIISRCETALDPLFTSLRRLSDKLLSFLSEKMQMRAKVQWEIKTVSSEKLDELEKAAKAFDGSPTENRISILARIKRMTIEAANQRSNGDDNLEIKSNLYRITGSCGGHSLASLRPEAGILGRNVLIEWIRYGNRETDTFPRLLSRIKALASLLHSFPGPDDFRTLRCSAFTHDSGECAFGLIYDIPAHPSTQTKPKTLADIITETATHRVRPTLESRLRLAHTLALSLAGFHNVGWLHKNISPYQVLFFIPHGSRAAIWIEHPYLTGFNHSRQDDPLAFTTGPTSDEVASRYYHPDYRRMHGPQVWYKLEFDYYSLGLVLLEIGLWMTLEQLGKDKKDPNKDMLEVLRTKRLPLLGHYMGTEYQDVVMACIDGLGNGETQDDNASALRLEFQNRVVEPLRRWNTSLVHGR